MNNIQQEFDTSLMTLGKLLYPILPEYEIMIHRILVEPGVFAYIIGMSDDIKLVKNHNDNFKDTDWVYHAHLRMVVENSPVRFFCLLELDTDRVTVFKDNDITFRQLSVEEFKKEVVGWYNATFGVYKYDSSNMTCLHEPKLYVGFIESYNYCNKCGDKLS
jgi:hypothetical protein